MDTLSEHEVRYLAALKRKPVDFETYPPVYQTHCFVEYLIARGTVSFTAKDIQAIFRHAELQKALADKPNIPRPSTIRTYINNAVKDGRFPLQYEESAERSACDEGPRRELGRVGILAGFGVRRGGHRGFHGQDQRQGGSAGRRNCVWGVTIISVGRIEQRRRA